MANVPQPKHSVEELMDHAEEHFEARRFRAAVMEAFVALEERIDFVVFTNLRKIDGFPDELVDWLASKTRMDVASRLHPIGEAALGKSIGKEAPLFTRYLSVKKIRNKVSHTAAKVTEGEARNVLQVVREWLNFLENAEIAFPAIREQPEAQEFLVKFSILQSRFRLRREDGSIASFDETIRKLADQGLLSMSEADEILFFYRVRNHLVHARPEKAPEVAGALNRINALMPTMKGKQFGFL